MKIYSISNAINVLRERNSTQIKTEMASITVSQIHFLPLKYTSSRGNYFGPTEYVLPDLSSHSRKQKLKMKRKYTATVYFPKFKNVDINFQ